MKSLDAYKCCLGCGYIVEGLPEPRCPECGREFDPWNRDTYGPPAVAGRVLHEVAYGAIVPIWCGGLLLLGVMPLAERTGWLPWWLVTYILIATALGGVGAEIVVLALAAWRALFTTRPGDTTDVYGETVLVSLVVLAGLLCLFAFLVPNFY